MIFRKIFCIFALHSWKYKKEKHKIINHPSGREFVRVPIRECEICGHREHHLLPKFKGFTRWRSFDHIEKEQTIIYSEY